MSDKKVKISNILESQIPDFIQSESPLFKDFLEQYYISEEREYGNVNLSDRIASLKNIGQFKDLNYTGIAVTTAESIFNLDDTINVSLNPPISLTHAGFPEKYGLIKINNEIITYTGITENSFTGCVRGFSGIDRIGGDSQPEYLNFNTTDSSIHDAGSTVQNLSFIFLQEFYKKHKTLYLPGFENRQLQSVSPENILSRARDFYSSKGTDTSLKILFSVLFGKNVEILKPFDNTIISSGANWKVTDDIIVESLSGDPTKLIFSTIFENSVDNPTASGSISNVEPIFLGKRKFFKISFSSDSIINDFSINSKTRVVSVGSENSTVTVDSTMGFPESGSFFIPDIIGEYKEVRYDSKSYNQFFNCIGIPTGNAVVENASVIGSNFVYGYEDFNTNNLVTMRVVGSLNGLSTNSENTKLFESENKIKLKHLGEKYEETDIHNSFWFYNNSYFVDVQEYDIPTRQFTTEVKHFLNRGDVVDIFNKETKQLLSGNKKVINVTDSNNFTVDNLDFTNQSLRVEVKKKISYVDKDLISIDLLGDIQNSFSDSDKNTYIAFSGYPSNVSEQGITNRSKEFNNVGISTLIANALNIVNHNFLNGEKIYVREIEGGGSGISTGYYFTKVVDDATIKLCINQKSLINDEFVSIPPTSNVFKSEITPSKLYNKSLINQNNFKRIYKNPEQSEGSKSIVGPIGVSLKGVEINSPISNDSIYYGQIDEIFITNTGSDYNLINPPEIFVDADDTNGSGAVAHGNFKGKINSISITNPGFDYIDIPKVKVIGGNGTNSICEAEMRGFTHSVSFNESSVNVDNDRIKISGGHKFLDGEEVTYFASGTPIGIGSTNVGFGTDRLTSNSNYFISKVNDNKFKLAISREKALSKGAGDLIDLTNDGSLTHTFRSTKIRKIIDRINVIDSTNDFSNKKVIVDGQKFPPDDVELEFSTFSGINVSENCIYARNHSFNDGDNVVYSKQGTTIGGLTNGSLYKVKVIDNNKFKLSFAGSPTNIISDNYNQNVFVDLTSIGNGGTHTFKYPDISVIIEGVYDSGVDSAPSYYLASAEAEVSGSVESVYIRNGGVGYGVTNIVNYEKPPKVKFLTGENAFLVPLIVDGKITSIIVKDGGKDYTTPPKIEIIGKGTRAKAIANINSNNSVESITIIDSGQDYDSNTTVSVIPSGKDSILLAKVHKWQLNDVERYSHVIQDASNEFGLVQIPAGPSIKENKLVSFYPSKSYRDLLNDSINDNDFDLKNESPILGFAYDGNPIYGPYISDTEIGIATARSSYQKKIIQSNLKLRPPGPGGYYTQDYVYQNEESKNSNSGLKNLDEYNGKFHKGRYSYFLTLDSIGNPSYPYITFKHRNKTDLFNYSDSINQSDRYLNSGDYKRNVTHLGINDNFRTYPFLSDPVESNPEIRVSSVKSDKIETVKVVDPGVKYNVGDQVIFNERSINAEVEKIKGKPISKIETTESEVDVKFAVIENNVVGICTLPHNLKNNDFVEISGVRTKNFDTVGESSSSELVTSRSFSDIKGIKTVKINTISSRLSVAIGDTTTTGVTTSISLTEPVSSGNIKPGDIFTIDNEKIIITAVDAINNSYKISRGFNSTTTSSHLADTSVLSDPSEFSFKIVNSNLENFGVSEKRNFDSRSVGIGTSFTSVVVGSNGALEIKKSIPPRGIYLPDHKFVTGDELEYVSVGGTIVAGAQKFTGAPSVSNEIKITASDGAANDLFGSSMFGLDIGSNKIVVGADGAAAAVGAIYVYNLDGTGEVKITASDGAAGDSFGRSAAIGSNKIVVGADGDDVGSNANQGSVYVYNLDGTGEVKITASDGASNDQFGHSVAIGSNKIVVGAYRDDIGSNADQGSVYVYNLDGTGEVKITASDGASNDQFGHSVAIGSNKIVVGAYRDDIGSNADQGSVYVYNLDGTGEVKITASDGASSDLFGTAVDVGDNKIVVGAYGDDDNGSASGSVYVYNLDGTGEVKITASDGASNDQFGRKVAITNNAIVVGSRLDDDNGSASGSVYVYNLEGTNEVKITASDGAAGDNFGHTVAIGNDKIVVGARLDAIGSNANQGSVYVYDLAVANNLSISPTFNLDTISKLYCVKLNDEFIGLSTQKSGFTTSFVHFVSATGIDHSLESTPNELIGSAKKVSSQVTLTKEHQLQVDDNIELDITPKYDQNYVFRFNSENKKLTTNRVTVTNAAVKNSTNGSLSYSIFSSNHGFVSGDAVIYTKSNSSSSAGLQFPGGETPQNKIYYVVKLDDDHFRLSNTKFNSESDNSKFYKLNTAGAGQMHFDKVNPKIEVYNGTTVVFDISDPSLNNYVINFYNDNEFKSRIGSESITRTSIGTSSISIQISDSLPSNFYYRVEDFNSDYSQSESLVDTQVNFHSEIVVLNSKFNKKHTISGIGSTTFNFINFESPELSSYTSSEFDSATYSTNSTNDVGPIHAIKIIDRGKNTTKIPVITSIASTTGKRGVLDSVTSEIGEIVDLSFTSQGIEIPNDNTLKPKADAGVLLKVKNAITLDSIGVTTGGNNYTTPPKILAIGREEILANAFLQGSSVIKTEILQNSSNIDTNLRIIPVNNSNGITVTSATSAFKTNTLFLKAPITGFTTATGGFPFAIGDQIFVEDIKTLDSADGYNSSDYDYQYFTVTGINTVGGTEAITYSIDGLGDNGGTFDPENDFGRVVKVSDLAAFEPQFKPIEYLDNEQIIFTPKGKISSTAIANVAENGWDSFSNTLRLDKISGKFEVGGTVKGLSQNLDARVEEVFDFDFDLNVGSTLKNVSYWTDEVGQLNNKYQRLHDSDYYQRFSYSVNGEVPYADWKEAVDSLNHISGYKNFADLVVSGDEKFAGATISDTDIDLKLDIVSAASVHTITNYDSVSEDTNFENLSKLVIFENKIITDYNESRTNKVLIFDDISPQFTGQIENTNSQLVGLTTFTLTIDGNSAFLHTFNPSSISNDEITIIDHNFNTGEELVYSPTNDSQNSGSAIGIAATSSLAIGIGTTNILPTKVFAIKVTNDKIKLAIGSSEAFVGTSVSFTSTTGIGNTHSLAVEPTVATSRSIITIDNVIQSPLTRKDVLVGLTTEVGIGTTSIFLNDIKNVSGNSLVQIDEEILKVGLVGVGATNIVNVSRGQMGTVAAAHTVGAATTIISGDYRIRHGKIYFKDAPYGPTGIGTLTTRSIFGGRAYYKLNYSKNVIMDDISEQFDGRANTDKFGLKSNNVEVSGISSDFGVILINNIFQRPFFGDVGSILESDYTLVGSGQTIDFTGTRPEDLPNGGLIDEFDANRPDIITAGNELKITASDGASLDEFGKAVAVGNNKIIIGSADDGGNGYQSGSVYVYNLDGTGETKITASDGAAQDQFGSSVAVGNNKIVVGAFRDDDDGSSSGSAYVYDLDGTNEVKITASDGAADDQFGFSVAVGNSKVVIGSPNDDDNGSDSGSVYVYNLNGTGEVKITASDGAASDRFGSAVAVGNDKIVVGAKGDAIGSNANQGSVYVYNLDGTGEVKITASDGAAGDNFGVSIAIANNKIVVGANSAGTTGAVYVYNLDGTGEVKITASDGAAADLFGLTVAIDNNKVIVGASDDDDNGNASGSVYVYNLDGTGEIKITSSDGAALDKFGEVVAIGDSVIVVGASDDDDNGNQSGSVYLYTLGVKFGIAVPTRALASFTIGAGSSISSVTVGVGSTGISAGGGGYITPPVVFIEDPTGVGAAVTAIIGAGGTISSFDVTAGGSGYTSPTIIVDKPSPYKNIPLVGGSGSGATMDIVVGTGGSVTKFELSNPGIGYEINDVLSAPSLPLAVGSGVTFSITVKSKHQDKFAGWAFGQLIELDDFSNLFNDFRKTFLLTRTETTKEYYSIVAAEGSGIILQNNFLIFLNDVLQKPGIDYTFLSGTRITFTEAPRSGSKFKIYFYTGSIDDFFEVDIEPTIKPGDELRLQKENPLPSQDQRVVYELIAADTVETQTYSGAGISTNKDFKRPVAWTKQTNDLVIDGINISKQRNYLEPRIFPTSNIIAPVNPTDSKIYVENTWPFQRIDNLSQTNNDIKIVGQGTTTPEVEVIQKVTYNGDYGDIIGISTSATGINTTTPMIVFDLTPDKGIYAASPNASQVSKSGINTGDYFVIKNTYIGSGVTSITDHPLNIVSIGTTTIDNVYYANQVVSIGSSIIRVSSNVDSLSGINTFNSLISGLTIGNYCWGSINLGVRDGKSFVFQNQNGLAGIQTSAHVSRTQEMKLSY